MPVDELLAARQPEDQLGLRIVEHAPYELLDGGDRRPADELAGHERERLSCVGAREEQAGDEPERDEDARAGEDRAGGVGRRNSRQVEERGVEREGHDEGGSRDEDGEKQAAPCVARPQEASREVEQQRDPPGQLEHTLDVAEDVGGIRRVDCECRVGGARADAAADAGEPDALLGDTSSSGSSPTRKVATADPHDDPGRSAET